MNTNQGKPRPHFAAESMCVPGGGTTLVPVDRPMPCIVIFVHGVNSEGEWYDIAERALVEGLNARLGRKDLVANTYDENNPRNFQSADRSPVIRFYWGYRAPQEADPATGVTAGTANSTQRFTYGVPLKSRVSAPDGVGGHNYIYYPYSFWDPKSNNPKAKYYWGGGAFQNGTTTLNAMFLDKGFDPHVLRLDLSNRAFNPEPDRPLNPAPPRTYYAHAARRLADLIDTIYAEHPNDTVAVVSHSQGTMVAALAMLMVKRVPDTLFLCNSPYRFEDTTIDNLTLHDQAPTAGSRVRTFFNLLTRFQNDRRVPDAYQLQGVGYKVPADGEPCWWDPSHPLEAGHDNHGRVFVYCNPHDRVMGSVPLQSIGWKGVDCALSDNGNPKDTTNPFRKFDGVLYQRQFMRACPVGDAPQLTYQPNTPRHPTDGLPVWMPASVKVEGLMSEQAPINWHAQVYVNGPAVPEPVSAEEMKNFNETKVLDDSGTEKTLSEADDFPNYKELMEEKPKWVSKKNPAWHDEYTGARQDRLQTPAELEALKAVPTNHSTILMGPQNPHDPLSPQDQRPQDQRGLLVKRILAYDLPIGCADSFDRNANEFDSGVFWEKLRHMADWLEPGSDAYYESGTLEVPPPPQGLDPETREVVQADIQHARKAHGSA